MNWEALGAIGEAAGAVAVVVSLVYVAVQVRHNNQLRRRAATADAVSSFREWSAHLLASPELTRVYQKGCEGMGNLDSFGRVQFAILAFNRLKTLEDLHYQYIKGAMDPDVWSGWESLSRGYVTSPGYQEYLADRHSLFSPQFQDWIDSLSAIDGFRRLQDFAEG